MAASGSIDRRVILHSIYFDATKKVAQGRKVALGQASDHPSLSDLGEALQALGLPHTFENKTYSRDTLTQRGRFRVSLLGDDGEPYSGSIPDRARPLARTLFTRSLTRTLQAKLSTDVWRSW